MIANKTLFTIVKNTGWLLVVVLALYFISGYSMANSYILTRHNARLIHECLAVPAILLLLTHVISFYVAKKQLKKCLLILSSIVACTLLGVFVMNFIL